MTRLKRDLLILTILHAALAIAGLVALFVAEGMAQTCTPPLFQGWPSSCSVINLRWLNRDNSSLIERYEIYIGAQLRGTAPGNALSFSDPVGCGFGANYIIRQVMKSGATCQTLTTGGPHTGPCSTCNNSGAGVSIVSAANFRGSVSRGALVSAFSDPGVSFTDRPEVASSIPLPTSLGGVSVEADGRLCGIAAVTAGQINFVLPDDLPTGPTEVGVTINTLRSPGRFFGRAQLNPNAPGIFTANATGEGAAASLWLRVDAKGNQRYHAPGTLPPLIASDQVFLILYGTGIHEANAELILSNGRRYPSFHSLATVFPGLWQLAFGVPIGEVWAGQVSGFVRVPVAQGFFDSQGFDLKR